jgi:hypothetical protein
VDKRQAKTETHSIVSALIDGAVLNMHDGWADNEPDHERIKEALRQIGQQHSRLGRKAVDSEASPVGVNRG